jgi:hypothetical protein
MAGDRDHAVEESCRIGEKRRGEERGDEQSCIMIWIFSPCVRSRGT